MVSIPLEDYRASHFLLNFLHSQMQGWYTRENYLQQLQHPECNEQRLTHLGSIIDSIRSWHAELKPGGQPLVTNDGRTGWPDIIDELCEVLDTLYEQFVQMGGRVTEILNKTEPLSQRGQDAEYLVACLAWIVYALDNALQWDIRFGETFADEELLKKQNQMEASQNDIDNINSMYRYLKLGSSHEQELFDLIQSMSQPLPDEDIKNYALAAGRYLKFFGR